MSLSKESLRYAIYGIIIIAMIFLSSCSGCSGCGCGEEDDDGDGVGAEEDAPQQLPDRRSPPESNPCDNGGQLDGSLTSHGAQTGNTYTGTVTALACGGAATFEAYFKTEQGTKIDAASGQLQEGKEFSRSFSRTTVEEVSEFCIDISGGSDLQSQCFS